MARIAHIADTHLGYRKGKLESAPGVNLRQSDVRRAFGLAIEAIIVEHRKNPIDVFVHAGDIFDRPRPTFADIALAGSAIRDLQNAGIPQLWISGNHDCSRLVTSESPLSLLAKLLEDERTRFAVNRDSDTLYAPTVTVTGLAWGFRPDHDLPTPAVPTRLFSDRPLVLVGHGEIVEIDRDRNQRATEINLEGVAVDVSDVDYVALGHLHVFEDPATNVHYAGSTERFGWRDFYASPSWSLVTIGENRRPTVSKRYIDARPMIDLGTVAVADIETTLIREIGVAQQEGYADTALFRIRVSGVNRAKIGELRRRIDREYGDRVLSLQIDIAGVTTETSFAFAEPTEKLSILALFDEFLSERYGTDRDFGSRFKERGRSALVEAQAMEIINGD